MEGACPMCYGPGIILGRLGNLIHLTCRNCGMQYSIEYEDDTFDSSDGYEEEEEYEYE